MASVTGLQGTLHDLTRVAQALLNYAPLLILDEPPPTWTPPPSTSYGMRSTRRRRDAPRWQLHTVSYTWSGWTRSRCWKMEGVVERGTYEELLKANSLYKRMVEVQNQMLITS
jgi:CubicO group peptidase (beta-lactamase class C family)